MLKRFFFYFIGFVVLASLAYYGFSRWQASKEKVDLWAIVPESAALVIESNNHQALGNHLHKTELWQQLEVLPVMQEFEENMAVLDSVSPSKLRLNRFFNEKTILTSVHVTSKTSLNFVFYIPVNSVGEHRFLRTITENIARNPDFEQTSRKYNGVLLTEVYYKPLDLHYTYFSYHNNMILSASSTLIEEVVRRAALDNPTSVAAEYKNANYLEQPDVYANVYINNRQIPALLNLFLKDEIMPQVQYLSSLCRNGMLQLKLDENKISLNGFSNPELLKGSMHNNLLAVKPKPILVKKYLPTRTAVMLHFGVQQIARVKQLNTKAKPAANDATIDSLASTFKQELVLAYLETNTTRNSPEKVLYALSGNKRQTLQLLQKLNTDQVQKNRLYTGVYGGYKIQEMAVPELPEKLFGEMFSGFEQVYIVELDNYILFTDELSTAHALIDDILAEKVWSKSPVQQALQGELLQEANFSFYINTINAWYILSRYTSEEERESLLQASSFIKKFNQVSVQYAKVESQYYTSIVIRKQESSNVTESNYNTAFSIPFDSRLVSRPYPVQNVVDKSYEVVVQDSAYTLYNITADGKRTWTDSLGSSVRGTIKQLPIGPENRLRYLFATSNRIHAINNQGESLENFPFNLADSLNIQRLTILDYDRSGNYNLLVDDNLGNLYMYDIRGNAIQGWQPRRLDHKLAADPQHLRIGTRDVILVMLENGYVYALNKNGDTYQGFPFSLKSPVTSGAVAKVGADLRKTELKTVTRYGEVITFNLQGRVLRRDKLPRPSKRAMFEMVQAGNDDKAFVFARQEQGKVAIFNQEQKLLFEKRFVTSAPKLVQYYNFGGDNIIYAITETGPQKTYLYDATGRLIGGNALDSSEPVTIYHNEAENSFSLYKVYRRELQKINFRLKR
ncbi:hypothetical protein JAO76_01100 [Pontibacter sp. BT310]|uniref:DUF3352 domain-containing protein n=1 Tax=Pontibacter populi TaxID=890055 RepID=A0ABS6X8X6_9BACT|nr:MULTISPECIES: hypothetical protein [Pontibacter]MBJ6116767.1 hypothetical protein [Pontibacter sp. BT310]MBR0569189.1 hypothetical protein [Microvirga sp. STS03]MBW3363620.1 hypothetical protein [Pontibacter populi]